MNKQASLLKNGGKNSLRPITIDDYNEITTYINKHNFLSCELNFANIFSWSEHYPMKFTQLNNSDDLVLFYEDENILMLPNLEITPQQLHSLSQDIGENNSPFVVTNVTKDYLAKHLDINNYFEIQDSEDFAEYIYCIEKLVNLKGKKLRKKKRHVIKFLENNCDNEIVVKSLKEIKNIPFQKINFDTQNICKEKLKAESSPTEQRQKIINDCRTFLNKQNKISQKQSNSRNEDFTAIMKAMEYADDIHLDGIVIYLKNKIIAFALFTQQNSNTVTIHFEKIDHKIAGASQFLNYSTAIYLLRNYDCIYMNREQDLGIAGLRHSKRSLDPEFIFQVFNLKIKNQS
ncbi:phosphatidylglycerol lysyltransferase domain-containing protein [Lentisphaerota bacterium WC36G]|nr:phosphatidylglycerol lysyltransferase domain-containing protein [Lentisphaerae bacterium WC36]